MVLVFAGTPLKRFPYHRLQVYRDQWGIKVLVTMLQPLCIFTVLKEIHSIMCAWGCDWTWISFTRRLQLSCRQIWNIECVYWVLWPWILVQAGHDFPIILSTAIGGSFLSYIYSAPPLKVSLNLDVFCALFWELAIWIITRLPLWLYDAKCVWVGILCCRRNLKVLLFTKHYCIFLQWWCLYLVSMRSLSKVAGLATTPWALATFLCLGGSAVFEIF